MGLLKGVSNINDGKIFKRLYKIYCGNLENLVRKTYKNEKDSVLKHNTTTIQDILDNPLI